MEKNNQDMRDDENLRAQQDNTSYENENAGENSDAQASGDDIISEGLEHKHQQQHGNRKYESYTNHSSASDQPGNITDTGQGI